ncbi:MAG: diguanylate cyclase [Syntrophales bacterium]|jgi:diguanylate cyclase (GGDEF)-like protein|nr:diguanylate cyclase [Syntrophales bacterium]
MKIRDMTNSGSANLKKYLWTLVLIWTVGIILSLAWNIYQQRQSSLSFARTNAEISYKKDLIYRRWVSNQGGVYVPVSEMTPANPYLKVPNRDIMTSDGLSLTLVNPAYMTRQVNELAAEMHGFQGHITSLNPIRPENRPDPWETEVLKTFERENKEAVSIEMLSGKEYFRFMRPFVTEKACLKCHAAQGYKEGDIRGGISVSIPMEPLRAIERSRMAELILAHGFLWMIGLVGIGAGTRRLWSQALLREKLEEELLNLSITDPLTGLHNRRGFLSLAEQQLKLSDRNKRGVQLYFADLDGLKRINDTLGHEEGDKALMEAATVFKETFRTSDIVARLGGDEFAALAVDITEENSDIFTARLQFLIDIRNLQESRRYRLSISVGCAYHDPGHPCSLDDLVASADQLMYEQKKSKNGLLQHEVSLPNRIH